MNAYITTPNSQARLVGSCVTTANPHALIPDGYVSDVQSSRAEGQYVSTAGKSQSPKLSRGRITT